MYKPELKQEMIKLISEFFQIEKGNRITSFNIDGLLAKIHGLFAKHEISENADT